MHAKNLRVIKAVRPELCSQQGCCEDLQSRHYCFHYFISRALPVSMIWNLCWPCSRPYKLSNYPISADYNISSFILFNRWMNGFVSTCECAPTEDQTRITRGTIVGRFLKVWQAGHSACLLTVVLLCFRELFPKSSVNKSRLGQWQILTHLGLHEGIA